MRKMPTPARANNEQNKDPLSAKYHESHPDIPLKNIYFVGVDQYAICSDNFELITEGLNRCSALSIKANGKSYLAHFSSRPENISSVKRDIEAEFNANFLQKNTCEIKVTIGSSSEPTDSIKSIFLLLKELKLIDRFLKRLQQDVRQNIEAIAEKTSLTRQDIYKFLAINNIKNVKDIANLVKFVNEIKITFQDKEYSIIEQHKPGLDIQFASASQGMLLLINPKFSNPNDFDNILIDINILLEKYSLRNLPNQGFSLFKPKHQGEAHELRNLLESVRLDSKLTPNEKLAELYNALIPFVNETSKGGLRLKVVFDPIVAKITPEIHNANIKPESSF